MTFSRYCVSQYMLSSQLKPFCKTHKIIISLLICSLSSSLTFILIAQPTTKQSCQIPSHIKLFQPLQFVTFTAQKLPLLWRVTSCNSHGKVLHSCMFQGGLTRWCWPLRTGKTYYYDLIHILRLVTSCLWSLVPYQQQQKERICAMYMYTKVFFFLYSDYPLVQDNIQQNIIQHLQILF